MGYGIDATVLTAIITGIVGPIIGLLIFFDE